MMFIGSPPIAMAEVLVLTPHHVGLTHLDAVVHMPVDGHVYVERPLGTPSRRQASSGTGRPPPSPTGWSPRGVLLDLAPGDQLPTAHPVTGADLEAAAERAEVSVEPGDALVVRGGWTASRDRGTPTPGLTVDALRRMTRHDVALDAGDIGDAHPPIDGQVMMPLHQIGPARLGMPLIDVVEIDATRLLTSTDAHERSSLTP